MFYIYLVFTINNSIIILNLFIKSSCMLFISKLIYDLQLIAYQQSNDLDMFYIDWEWIVDKV